MEKILWNTGWTFWKESNAFSLFQAIPADAEKVDLPHDAMFLEHQDADCASEGKQGFLPGGTYKYYKEYFAPQEDEGKVTKLLFDGASTVTTVFVNDSCVYTNVYPFTGFYVDLTPYLHFGSVNRILAVVTVMELSSRFYAGGGLFRNVSLIKEPLTGFVPEELRITTRTLRSHEAAAGSIKQEGGSSSPADTGGQAGDISDVSVCIRVLLQNRLRSGFKGMYCRCISDRAGSEIFAGEYCLHLAADSVQEVEKQAFLSGITPWDADHPELYSVSVSLTDAEGNAADCDETLTGFRIIELDAQHGLRVNGKEVKLLGGCVHADQGLLGGATYLSYEYRRMQVHKKNGFNAVRCAHNPASKALLRACDELGIYVLDETTDIWGKMKNPQDYSLFFERDIMHVVENMVRADYNHPSVLLYSTGNEIMDIGTDKGYELTMQFTDLLHRLDGTRFVTNAVNALLVTGPLLAEQDRKIESGILDTDSHIDVNSFMAGGFEGVGKIILIPPVDEMLEYIDGAVDISGYNYMLARYEQDAQKYPNRIILGTETHSKRIPDHFAAMQKHKNIIGDFIWCSYTYLGENGGKENFPSLMNESSDFTVIGDVKPGWYYRAVTTGLRAEPYIAVRSPEKSRTPMNTGAWVLTDAAESWDYPGHEGEACDVEVYSSGERTELFLNGRSLGEGNPDPEQVCRYTWRVPYDAGELKAVSVRSGEPDREFVLHTKGAACVIDLQAEENPFAEEDGLKYVNITLRNAAGEAVRCEAELTVSITDGAYRLLAFGGQDTRHNGGFISPGADIHDGRALVILKRLGEGKGMLKVSGKGLAEAVLEL